MSIQYIDRETKSVREEKIYGHRALSLLYGDSWISRLFSLLLLPFLSRVAFFSKFYGFLQKQPCSAKKIAPFVSAYGVDTSEFETQSFASFNDFFIRKLKKEKRPIVPDPAQAVMPADGRYLVFPNLALIQNFYVKGKSFDLSSFLQNDPYARRFADGSMVVARLCPTDYHRFHFIADGIPAKANPICGHFHSVNPMALKKDLSIFWNNKRVVTDFDTEMFGKVLYVEVGAICVGTIHQTYAAGQKVRKGDEKGYFSFGGSCIVILFEKGTILFDDDLIANSQKGFETKANFGQSLGKRKF